MGGLNWWPAAKLSLLQRDYKKSLNTCGLSGFDFDENLQAVLIGHY
jgi:hypothetical protein